MLAKNWLLFCYKHIILSLNLVVEQINNQVSSRGSFFKTRVVKIKRKPCMHILYYTFDVHLKNNIFLWHLITHHIIMSGLISNVIIYYKTYTVSQFSLKKLSFYFPFQVKESSWVARSRRGRRGHILIYHIERGEHLSW